MGTLVSACNNVKQKVEPTPEFDKFPKELLDKTLQYLPKRDLLNMRLVSRKFPEVLGPLLKEHYTSKTPFIVAGPGVDGTIAERMKFAREYAIVHLRCINLMPASYHEFIDELLQTNDGQNNYCQTIQTLGLRECNITDIRPLTNMTNLERLDLSHNQITNIGALAHLTKLERLNLRFNQIADIRALANMTKLKRLNLADNQIDIDAIAHMTSLERLDLSGNKISDIGALTHMNKLRRLNLCGNRINNIGALANMTSMERLDLSTNYIADIEALTNMTKLERLDLTENQIANIGALANMTKLKTLAVADNQIDIDTLADMTSLKTLAVASDQIIYFDPDRDTINIDDIDINALTRMTNLERLYLSNVDDEIDEEVINALKARLPELNIIIGYIQ